MPNNYLVKNMLENMSSNLKPQDMGDERQIRRLYNRIDNIIEKNSYIYISNWLYLEIKSIFDKYPKKKNKKHKWDSIVYYNDKDVDLLNYIFDLFYAYVDSDFHKYEQTITETKKQRFIRIYKEKKSYYTLIIKNFCKKHWQWVIGTSLTLLGLIIAVIAL